MHRRRFLRLAGLSGAGAAVQAVVPATAHAAPVASDDRCYARTHAGRCDVHWSVDTDERVAALTFDDGPSLRYTEAVLELLAAHGATATFFAIGANVERHPDLAAAVAAAGHELGNHTQGHHRVETLPYADLRREIASGAAAIEAATGQRTRWFRPPRGMVTGAVLAAAAAEGHDVAMWSVTRGGPSVPDGDADAVLASMRRHLHPGAVLCLHDGVGVGDAARRAGKLIRRRDAELLALGRFLEAATEDGYRFVSFGELLASGRVPQHIEYVSGR